MERGYAGWLQSYPNTRRDGVRWQIMMSWPRGMRRTWLACRLLGCEGRARAVSRSQRSGVRVRLVPEPTTMIAGALLLLPFGASTLRMLRKSRKV